MALYLEVTGYGNVEVGREPMDMTANRVLITGYAENTHHGHGARLCTRETLEWSALIVVNVHLQFQEKKLIQPVELSIIIRKITK